MEVEPPDLADMEVSVQLPANAAMFPYLFLRIVREAPQLVALLLFFPFATYAKLPSGYKLDRASVSPNGHYALVRSPRNTDTLQLCDIETGQILAFPKNGLEPHYIESPSSIAWSKDSTLFVLMSRGKWGPTRILVFELADARIAASGDVLLAIQREMVARLKAAMPKEYDDARGNAADHSLLGGLTFDAKALPTKASHRINILAGMTADPNLSRLPKEQLEADMDVEITGVRKVSFEHFQAYSATELLRQQNRLDAALDTENKLYQQLQKDLPQHRRRALAIYESTWKTQVNRRALEEGFSYTGARWVQLETSIYEEHAVHLRGSLLRSKQSHGQTPPLR